MADCTSNPSSFSQDINGDMHSELTDLPYDIDNIDDIDDIWWLGRLNSINPLRLCHYNVL